MSNPRNPEPPTPREGDDFGTFFDGTVPAPEELRQVVAALQSPATAGSTEQRHAVVLRMAESLATANPQPGGIPVIGRRSRRIAVLAAAGSLVFGGVAAAAGGAGVLGDVLGTSDETEIDAGDETTSSSDSETTSSETTIGEEPTTSVDETTTSLDETTTTLSPEDQACADAENHGDFVSDVAKNKDHEGNHGSVVSEAAKSDCGKDADDDSDDDADDDSDDDADDDSDDDADDDSDDGDHGDDSDDSDDDAPGQSGDDHGKSGDDHGKSGEHHGNDDDSDDDSR